MNARERKVIDRIDDVLRVIGSLTPQNPADIQAITRNLPLATKGARHASAAITYLRSGEWWFLDAELADAERLLGIPSRSVPTGQEAEHG